MGIDLWEGIRTIFAELGNSPKITDSRLDQDFFEGVFFDMTGICEAQWMRTGK